MRNKLYNIMTAEELLDEIEGDVGEKIRAFFTELQVEIVELEESLDEKDEAIAAMEMYAEERDERIEDLEQFVEDQAAEIYELKETNQVLHEAAENLRNRAEEVKELRGELERLNNKLDWEE